MSSPLLNNSSNKSSEASWLVIQQQLEQPHPHIMIDGVLPNCNGDGDICRSDKNKTTKAATISNGLSAILADKSGIGCGPSSASSTSGYDDSSDGEDNHLINHTHHNHNHSRHHHHDAFNRQQQQQQLASTKLVNDNNIDSSNNNSCSISNLVRDMHLDEVVGICERDPHELTIRQTQLKANSVNNSRQLNHSNNDKNYLSTQTTHHQQQQQQQQQLVDDVVDQVLRRKQDVNQLVAPRIQVRPIGLSTFPIDDFDCFEESYKYSDGEKQLRIKMCAVYRLIEIYGWSMGIYNHVTAKVEGDHEHLLIHPFGLHYNEITASSMLKIDLAGNIVDNGSTNFELNRPGYLVHSAIHMTRPDIGAVIHLHYPPVAAASAFKYGLLPICQEQALLGEVRYLDYTGILTDEDEREAVASGLGEACKVMILRNHGLIVCGATIEEAFYLLSNLMKACETQARLLALGGMENLVFMSPEAAQQAYELVQSSRYPVKVQRSDKKHAQIVGHINMFELDFEAQMRSLDHAGHRTGYHYKRPLVRKTRQLNNINKRW